MGRLTLLCLSLIAVPLAAQSSLASADSALAAGQPWRASQLIAPLLTSPATRTPAVVLLAARAAAAWEGWPTVRRLLDHETWVDSLFDRLGRRLLAEADLGEFRNPQAVVDARTAVAGAARRAADEQARRLVILARAYDRLNQLDSAALAYRQAMDLSPDVADWLALRVAGVTRDSAARAALYATVALPPAVVRIPWTEALARDRLDDFAGAAIRYARLGARVSAVKVRWRAAATDSVRQSLAADLATIVRTAASSAEARDALDLIETIDPPFTHDDRIEVGRRALAVNRPQDAVTEFAAAARESALAPADRVTYGTALGAVARWTDAAEVFADVTDPAVAGRAAYYRARALMRAGQPDAAVPLLRHVVRGYPADTFAAATALHLLGDLAIDAGDADSARSDYLRLAELYPSSALRPHAIFLAALIALERGNPDVAERELTRAIESRQVTGEVDASRYWLSRARLALGDTVAARAGLRELAGRGPDNYYAVRAAARLDTVPWRNVSQVSIVPPDSLDSIFARAQRLDLLGMDAEAKLERDRVASEARGVAAERAAAAFFARGFMSRAAQLALRATSAGAGRTAAIWEMLYPLPFAAALRETAAREQVDPLMVASVIRQESGFEPHATSRTDARGLMQVQPATGQELAQSLGFPDFDPAVLWIGQVSLALGIHHLAIALARYPDIERGLAAYNAGTARVDRWSLSPLSGRLRPADHARDPLHDVEVFVERIPFVETRDYVRAILRNDAVYRMLYGR